MLTPVDNPTAYGLVETEGDGRVRRFLEKPNPDEITCDTINAGIYVLEPDTFDRIPKDVSYSIERAYFPSLIERKETFVAYIDRGYWIDIGTPEKYVQVHHDMFDGKFAGGIFAGADRTRPIVSPEARIEDGVTLRRAQLHRCRRARESGREDRPLYRARPRRDRGRSGRTPGHHRVAQYADWPGRGGAGADHRPQLPHRAQREREEPRRARRQDAADRLYEPLTMFNPSVFKAYDVRGLYPSEITEELFHQLGRAFVAYLGPGRFAVTRDMRVSSPSLTKAFIDGVVLQGGTVLDYGLLGTDQMYYAVAADKLDGGAQVTASHNPGEYNGCKMVPQGSVSVERRGRHQGNEGDDLRRRDSGAAARPGSVERREIMDRYIEHVLSFVDEQSIKPFNVVLDAGSGVAGLVAPRLFDPAALQDHAPVLRGGRHVPEPRSQPADRREPAGHHRRRDRAEGRHRHRVGRRRRPRASSSTAAASSSPAISSPPSSPRRS